MNRNNRRGVFAGTLLLGLLVAGFGLLLAGLGVSMLPVNGLIPMGLLLMVAGLGFMAVGGRLLLLCSALYRGDSSMRSRLPGRLQHAQVVGWISGGASLLMWLWLIFGSWGGGAGVGGYGVGPAMAAFAGAATVVGVFAVVVVLGSYWLTRAAGRLDRSAR